MIYPHRPSQFATQGIFSGVMAEAGHAGTSGAGEKPNKSEEALANQ